MKRSLNILVLIALLTACQPGGEVTLTAIPADTAIIAPYITPTLKIQPTSTSSPTVQTSLTPTIEISATTALVNPVFVDCIDISKSFQDNMKLEGQLVLGMLGGGYYLFDLKSSIKTPLLNGNEDIFDLDVSPNGSQLLLLDCSEAQCMGKVVSANGVVNTFPNKKEWRIIHWLDNVHLAIVHDNEPLNSVIVLNPFTGEELSVELNLPHPFYMSTPSKKSVLISIIDPTMTRVIYFDTEGLGRIILWDIQKEKILAWLPFSISIKSPITSIGIDYLHGWSPDGTQYITTSPDISSSLIEDIFSVEELYSITSRGGVTQLTHFGDEYRFVRIREYRWSPDGRYIAFWFQTNIDDNPPDGEIYRLGIIDTTTSTFIDPCLIGANKDKSAFLPIWSPNSDQLLLRILDGDGKFRLFILDLPGGKLYQLDEAMFPEGWIGLP